MWLTNLSKQAFDQSWCPVNIIQLFSRSGYRNWSNDLNYRSFISCPESICFNLVLLNLILGVMSSCITFFSEFILEAFSVQQVLSPLIENCTQCTFVKVSLVNTKAIRWKHNWTLLLKRAAQDCKSRQADKHKGGGRERIQISEDIRTWAGKQNPGKLQHKTQRQSCPYIESVDWLQS